MYISIFRREVDMPVITINGPVGSGPIEVGQRVSQLLHINYVDRLVFAEAAKLIGSPVGVLIEKEQRVIGFREKLGRFLQTTLERSAVAGISGEPYFGRVIELLPAETYIELAGDSSTLPVRRGMPVPDTMGPAVAEEASPCVGFSCVAPGHRHALQPDALRRGGARATAPERLVRASGVGQDPDEPKERHVWPGNSRGITGVVLHDPALHGGRAGDGARR